MQKAETGGERKKLKVRKKLLNNLGLKLISVVSAVALWFVVVIADNPKETRTFPNIPVVLTNVDLLEKENKVYEVLDNTDTIRVTVEVPRSDLDKLRASDIVAEADMSKLTAVNTIAISLAVLNDDVNVTNITGNRDVVRLNVEDLTKKWVGIQKRVIGEVAEGYMVSDVSIDLTTIEVMGPKSAIDKISYAAVNFDITGATTNQTANVEPKLFDAEGKELNLSSVTKNTDHVLMTVRILAVKEVPIEVNSTGVPAEGYLATGKIDYEPTTVKIAGTPSALANISKIVIPEEKIDLTDAEENVMSTIYIKDYLPSNIQLADSSFNGRITATAYVEPVVEKILYVPEDNITILHMPEGFEWEFDENAGPYMLKISGLDAVVSGIQHSTVYGTVDMDEWMKDQRIRELKDGTYKLPVKFELSEDIGIEGEVLIQVIIAEVKEEDV